MLSICFTQAISIGKEAFIRCRNLTNATLPKVASIGSRAFYGSTLTTISLSKDAKDNIGADAFSDCFNLTTLHLLDLTAEEFEANPGAYTSFGDHEWQHIYYNGGEWHRDANN